MKRILVVEDDRNIALALSVRLRASSFEPLVAYDAVSGVSLALKHKPDLILLDVSMPAGGGFAVAERLRSLMPTGTTPIIFVTASKEAGLRQRAEALGAAGFFEKPYEGEELIAAIRASLGEEPSAEHPLG